MNPRDVGEVPTATCSSCGHQAKCIRVSDGTVYRPTAWVYPDPAKPLEGLCGGCRGPMYITATISIGTAADLDGLPCVEIDA